MATETVESGLVMPAFASATSCPCCDPRGGGERCGPCAVVERAFAQLAADGASFLQAHNEALRAHSVRYSAGLHVLIGEHRRAHEALGGQVVP